MTHLIWQRADWPTFSWQSSVILENLAKVRFSHGKLLAYAPLIENTRGDLLLIDYLDRSLSKETLLEFFGDFRNGQLPTTVMPPEMLGAELKKFLFWWNQPPVELDGLLRSGIALFWILTISPFTESNEEIAREICELALAQDERISSRIYEVPISAFVQSEDFKSVFRATVTSEGDMTRFLEIYLNLLLKSFDQAAKPSADALKSFQFWKKENQIHLNARQKKIMDRLVNSSNKEITNREYVELFDISRESAKRDLTALEKMKLIRRSGSVGRNVSYILNEEN